MKVVLKPATENWKGVRSLNIQLAAFIAWEELVLLILNAFWLGTQASMTDSSCSSILKVFLFFFGEILLHRPNIPDWRRGFYVSVDTTALSGSSRL